MRRRSLASVSVLGCLVLVTASAPSLAAGAEAAAVAPRPRPQVRVDQHGYTPGEIKHAHLMTGQRVRNATFEVVNAHHSVVMSGQVPNKPVDGWNRRYHAVYDLNFSRVHKPGRYRIEVSSPATASSPWFRIMSTKQMFNTLLRDGVSFDQLQRDGAKVIAGDLDRKPSHLTDAKADVYSWPTMAKGSDLITDKNLHRIGGPVDVEGGWFDAGDYLKFTHTSAYNDVLLFVSARLAGHAAPKSVMREARYGLQWLQKMWDAKERMLYIQVGVGSGNRAGTFYGDHDRWRLPQADDKDHRHIDRFISHRPVFTAAAPGDLISPNLVGRVSASFALAAQADAKSNPSRAKRELHQAELIYSRADTASPPHPLVTALPHAFYPESTWHDDMELGAAEIARAALALGQPSDHYISDAAKWARGYIRHETGDTLNLYDTSALAHAELASLLPAKAAKTRLAVTGKALRNDMRRQLRGAVHHAAHDPFSAGAPYDEFDVNSHTFALIATAGLYRRAFGSHQFDNFATRQRNWLLGGNPWGVSMMVGVGSRFPQCMQHQIANIKGTTNGGDPVATGAVVNGPNNASIFSGGLGGIQSGMVKCPPPPGHQFGAFDGRHSRFVDDVRSWQTDEPALDMTGAAIIAAAAQLVAHRH